MTEVLAKINPAANYLLTLSAGHSRLTQRSGIDKALNFVVPGSKAATFPWGSFTREKLLSIRSYLQENTAPATANRIISALKQVCREAWSLGLLTADELQRITAVKRVRGTRLPAGRFVTTEELKNLLQVASADKPRMAARNVALLHVLFFGGLRREEVVSLRVDDVILERSRALLRVVGKGNKQREVPLPRFSTAAIQTWLRLVEGDGALFPTRDGRFMKGENIHHILTTLAARAKLGKVTPHDGRRTFISYLLEANADIAAVQALAGHSKADTTLRYDRRPDQGKRVAVDKLPAF